MVKFELKCFKIYSPTTFDASRAFKLEEDFVGGCMTMSMYSSTDKMKMSAPSCFPGRYSPSYRSSEQMRRCMPNPSVRIDFHSQRVIIYYYFSFFFYKFHVSSVKWTVNKYCFHAFILIFKQLYFNL